HLDLRALREQRRADVTGAGGEVRRTAEAGQRRTRVMIFGEVVTSRIAYRKKGKPNLYPQDAGLGWGPRRYSAGVEARIAEAIAIVPAARAAAQVSAQGAVTVGKRQAEEISVAFAADFGGFYASRRPGPCGPECAVLLTCDGSAFTVRPDALRPATAKAAAARAQAAEESGWPDHPADLRKARKRTAELAAVADIPPAPRAPEDILTALFGPARDGETAPKPAPGPQAQGKTLFASVTRPAADVIADAFAEAHRRDPGRERPWIAVTDGNNHQIETIGKLAARYQVKVTILIDIIHVIQYLWKAAASLFRAGDPAARDWVRAQAGKILNGKHRDVLITIRRRAASHGYSPAGRGGADECARYLANKRHYLDYPAFLAAGWPVASGLIEGAARWLVKDRMEITGARWSLQGAEAILKLRALAGSGDFADYARYHFREEKRRTHDSLYQNKPQLTYPPPIVAA
ncbi:MAG: ISKra4 family transposase, partial [Acidobacteria bacterium]|nr:ISKra4 family transposase [Acidobacteriota bacterium]